MRSSRSSFWRVLAVAALLIALSFFLTSLEMAAVSWGDAIPLLPAVMTETHVGRVWTCFLPATGLLLAGAFLPQWSSARPLVLLVVATLLLLFAALCSHAADAGVIAVVVYFLHEIAVGLWIGALLGLWIVAKGGQTPGDGLSMRRSEFQARRGASPPSCSPGLWLFRARVEYRPSAAPTYGRTLPAR
jgi:putative copper export protein